MTRYEIEERIEELKRIDESVKDFDNEELWLIWIMVVPDGATDEDYEDIAEDDDFYEEVVSLYKKLQEEETHRAFYHR